MSKIGIFDSGIGGLAIAKSISQNLPNETLVYFGDTKHFPYGEKSAGTIKEYAKKITEYLLEKEDCKCIIIACNSASTASYEYLRDEFKGKVPIINVIDPIIERVVVDENIKNVGVIGTRATIDSGVYKEKFNRRKPTLHISQLATPSLAPMIENGYDKAIINPDVVNGYLASPELYGIDTLVLACTHYPYIKKQINKFYINQINLVDSIAIVTDKLKSILDNEKMLASEKEGDDVVYISEHTEAFQKNAKSIFGKDIKIIENDIFTQSE